MDSKPDGDGFPLFPPWSFVDRWNAGRPQDQPYRTGLDPLVMLAWHHSQQALDARTPIVILTAGM